MKRLLEGYSRFRREVFPGMKDRFRLLKDRQQPEVLFITCADSRVVPDLILQTEPGDMFLCRTAGNVVPPQGEMPGGVSATIEYAVEVLKVRHVIVCGHSDCGAVKAVLPPNRNENLKRLPLSARWLGYVEPAWRHLDPGVNRDDTHALHTALIHANVIAQVENLKTHPEVARGLAMQTLEVHGWYYDILTGAIEAWDERERKFAELLKGRKPMSPSPKSTAKEEPFPRGVAKPAVRALNSAGYTHLDQLARAREEDIAGLHGMGPKALRILREALRERGKSFRQD